MTSDRAAHCKLCFESRGIFFFFFFWNVVMVIIFGLLAALLVRVKVRKKIYGCYFNRLVLFSLSTF